MIASLRAATLLNTPRSIVRRLSNEIQISTWFIQLVPLGVKCK